MTGYEIFQVTRIINAAREGDIPRALAYAEHLAKYEDENGEGDIARRLRNAIHGTGNTVVLAGGLTGSVETVDERDIDKIRAIQDESELRE